MISKFNFIVMLMVEPSGNRYSESYNVRILRVLGNHSVPGS